jgi:hypothetical protein
MGNRIIGLALRYFWVFIRKRAMNRVGDEPSFMPRYLVFSFEPFSEP